jgi:uncharacterized protein (DUF1778 family)
LESGGLPEEPETRADLHRQVSLWVQLLSGDQKHDLAPAQESFTTFLAKIVGHVRHFAVLVDVMAEETRQTTARLEARLPNDVHALLKRAAEIEGRTLTDFVVSAAREAACRTIEATEIIRLSVEDQRQIAEALLNPPEPTPALKQAFQRRRELLGGE